MGRSDVICLQRGDVPWCICCSLKQRVTHSNGNYRLVSKLQFIAICFQYLYNALSSLWTFIMCSLNVLKTHILGALFSFLVTCQRNGAHCYSPAVM